MSTTLTQRPVGDRNWDALFRLECKIPQSLGHDHLFVSEVLGDWLSTTTSAPSQSFVSFDKFYRPFPAEDLGSIVKILRPFE